MFDILNIPKIVLAPGGNWFKYIELKKPFELYDWTLRSFTAGGVATQAGLEVMLTSDYTKSSLTQQPMALQTPWVNAFVFWKDMGWNFPLGFSKLLERKMYLKKGVFLGLQNTHALNTYTIDFSILGDYLDKKEEDVPTWEPMFLDFPMPNVAGDKNIFLFQNYANCHFDFLQILNWFWDGAANDVHYINFFDLDKERYLFDFQQSVQNIGTWPAPHAECSFMPFWMMQPNTNLQIEIIKYTALTANQRLFFLGRNLYDNI